MIDPEQKELADYVKNVHLSLRRKTKEIGAEKAWEEHLKNEDVLRKYSSSMKKLAEFWSANNKTQTDKFLCRIEWIINYVINYFLKGLLKIEFRKEFKKVRMFYEKGLIVGEELDYSENYDCIVQPRFKLMDVGSCFNPFQKFDFLEVFPIDLFPANTEVKKCNFLETTVGKSEKDWFHEGLKEIPSDFFDVVVFSLFLEYLPSPRQRYLACVKAYECLKTNGLLFIVTPDSKHATANAVIMKKWKTAAAQIGFVRTKLEKLKYLYCMAFRKTVCRKYPLLLYNIKSDDYNFEELFIIPQDSIEYKLEENRIEKSEEEEKELKEYFAELPNL